jgi:apolipoprotein N-acyltransferase
MKICIIKLSAMGDIIHSMIALQFIKQIYPSCTIDWIVEDGFKGILQNNNDINNILSINLKSIKKKKLTIFDQIKILKQYAKNNYDIVIDAQGLLKSAIVSKIVGKKIENSKIIGFDKNSTRERVASLFYSKKITIPYEKNVILRNIELLCKSLNIDVTKDMIQNKKVFLFSNTKNRLNGIMMVFITIFISFVLEQYKKPTIEPNLRIYMPNLDISQKDKWDIDKKDYLVELNLKYIQKAIEDKYDLILLSETSIPDIINTNQRLLDKLSKYSQKIDIIVGGLSQKNNIIYNSVYHFSQGKLQQIANKVVLVPFGEEIPLPQILVDWINETFYNGAKDYIPANNTTDFIVKGIRFRNSICYEATHYKMYHDNPKYMVALSNFAWFMPSIASVLQRKLLKYYSLRYNTIIYHNINGCKNYMVN